MSDRTEHLPTICSIVCVNQFWYYGQENYFQLIIYSATEAPFFDEVADFCISDSLKHLYNLHYSSIRASHILLKHIYCPNILVYKALHLKHLDT